MPCPRCRDRVRGAQQEQLPAAVITLSEWTDMTVSGGSIRERKSVEPIVTQQICEDMADYCVPNLADRTNP